MISFEMPEEIRQRLAVGYRRHRLDRDECDDKPKHHAAANTSSEGDQRRDASGRNAISPWGPTPVTALNRCGPKTPRR